MSRGVPPLVLVALAAVTAMTALTAGGARAQLGPEGLQGWHAGSDGLTTLPEEGARFGHATAAGDFDGNGFDDLAISSPYVTVNGSVEAGEVLVLYSGEDGLQASGHQVWSQESAGMPDSASPNDAFGWALAAGDFDADGFDDLVIGVPFEDIAGFDSAGVIQILRGSNAGITTEGTRHYEPSSALIPDTAEAGDRFGAALAVGDFNEDGYADLAVGSPGEDVEGMPAWVDLGALHVFFGSIQGLQASNSLFFRPGDGVIDLPPPADGISFGAALAAGRVIDGVRDQIVIGIPRLDVDGADGAGGLVVFDDPADPEDPEGSGEILGLLTQATTGVPGLAEAGDNFGAALAVGRFDGQSTASLAVGSPGEAVGADAGAGAAIMLAAMFTPDFAGAIWTQDDLRPLASEPGDRFGAEFAVGDFDADGRDDLVIGYPGEAIGDEADFGGAALLFGSELGLDDEGFQLLPFGTFIVQALETGFALTAGRFSGHSGHDLAISLPRASTESTSAAGLVLVHASVALFLDGFESEDTTAWSASSP